MDQSTKKSVVRRTLVWMAVAALSLGGALAFEHDSGARGVLLDQSTLVKNDGSCQGPHGEPKKDCVPCTDDKGHTHDCHPSCQKGNGDPKDNCVPCTDKHGKPKDCKPCKGVDKKGNPKPKHCVVSDDGSTTAEEGTVAGDG